MINTPQVPVLNDPLLIDYALLEIQQKIVVSIPWLDHAFGKAQRQKTLQDKKILIRPTVYVGDADYLPVFPDDNIGNFIFFKADDPQDVIDQGKVSKMNYNLHLIAWFNYKKVFPSDWEQKSIENVKSQFIQFFIDTHLKRSKITMNKFYEHGENIYKDYTDNEIKDQFLMRPYGGFRLSLSMKLPTLKIC